MKQQINITDLLAWVYGKQLAHRVSVNAAGMHKLERIADGQIVINVSADGIMAVQRNGLLGTQIDGGGMSAMSLHPDAEYVHEVVQRLGRLKAGLLIGYAIKETRPDWGQHKTVKLVPVYRDHNRRKAMVRYNSNRKPHWCPVSIVNEWDDLEQMRAIYSAWADACHTLWAKLQGYSFKRFELQADLPQIEPWSVGGVGCLDIAKTI